MTNRHPSAKRWRPRFSVRTLAVVVTLVCCYAACWGPTKKWGVEDARRHLEKSVFDKTRISAFEGDAWLPLVVKTTELIPYPTDIHDTQHGYYFWFFGYVAKLPFEREATRVEVTPPPVLFRDLKSVSPNPTIPIEREI